MIIERFNRTIKANIWRKFSSEKNNKYLTSLQDHVLNYNNRIHRSINDKPSNINKCNENQTFEKLSGFKRHEGGSNEPVFVKYSIGDYVRIALDKKIFEKKFEGSFGAGNSAISCGSGTDALHLAYLLAGVQPGDEVICTVFTCTASNLPALYIGATPVFADLSKKGLASQSKIQILIVHPVQIEL